MSLFARLAAALLLFAGAAGHGHPSRAIVVADDGRIFFTDLERLWQIGRDGRLRLLREHRDRHTHEVALDAAGNLIGEDSAYEPATGAYRETIWQLSPGDRVRTLYGPTTRPDRGVGVIRDARGCTYHANESMTGSHPLVHRRCPDGKVVRLLGSTADDRAFRQILLSNVAGAALDDRGNFIFRQGGAIRKIAPTGAVRTLATGIAKENLGLALGGDGSIFIAEAAARRILRVHPDGHRSVAATAAGPWSPTGVAVSRGQLYILEATEYRPGAETRMRVRRVAPGGRSTLLATVAIPLR